MKLTRSVKSYLSAFLILFLLINVAGILTTWIPTGAFERSVDGSLIENSFKYTSGEGLSPFLWLTAPIRQLNGSDSIMIISISLFLLIIGGSIHTLNETKTIEGMIDQIIITFEDKKYTLLAMISFLFMSLGAFVGIFEEVVPLVPFMIVLAKALGWDEMTGLGISMLSCGFGFSAAVTNPFTIGIAQQLIGLPIFSGVGYRLIVFIIVYLITVTYLIRYAKKIEKNSEDIIIEKKNLTQTDKKRIRWFASVMLIMLITLIASPFIGTLSNYSLILIAIFFIINSLGAAKISNWPIKETAQTFLKGALNMSPAIILVLMAASIKFIITTGGVMDTILYTFSNIIIGLEPFKALMLIYLLVLVLNFFVGSGSAKAFIVMSLIAPLSQLVGLTDQITVLAFQFGDGFSNVFYPTNAVLLMSLGFAEVSYSKWIKWVFKLQIIIFLVTTGLLYIGLKIGY